MTSVGRLGDLVKILAPILKKNRDGYLLAAKEEIDIIGMEATDQEVYFLADILLSSSDIGDALVTLASVNDGNIKERAERENARLEGNKQKVNAEAKAAADRRLTENLAAEEAKRIADEKTTERDLLANSIANALAAVLPPKQLYAEYRDYTVVQRSGSHEWVLRIPVAKAMSQGWVPVGGVHVLFNTNMHTALYSQAMALPADKPKSSLGYEDTF
jgi:hypothetical protein